MTKKNKRKLKKKYKDLLMVIAPFIIVLLSFTLVFMIDHIELKENKVINMEDNLPRNHYDKNKLRLNDQGHMLYDDKSKIGIDVSIHQDNIDWKLVKESGIDFVYIRLGYRGYQSGELNVDDKFKENIIEAKDAGLDVGVYFFSQAINKDEAIKEANFVIQHIKGLDIDLPIVYDLEIIDYDDYRTKNLTKRENTDNAIAFLNRIEKLGYDAMVYTNLNFLDNHYIKEEILEYKLWLAHFDETFDFEYQFDFWQYTDKGDVPGIDEPVDMNIGFNYE